MGFQIHPLPAERFQYLFDLSQKELNEQNACRMVVTEKPDTPCRVSMADAEVGDAVVLVNYTHQDAQSPYRASHAVFAREGVDTAQIGENEVPEVLVSRLISLRVFDENHMMLEADAVSGAELSEAISMAFEDEAAAYIHLHYAKPGCFGASVSRTKCHM
jgi:hypothetical protein